MCRSDREINNELKSKISLFCNIPVNRVITAINSNNIYEVPLLYRKEKLDKEVLKYFNISKFNNSINLEKWKKYVKISNNPKKIINIAIVGKYTNLADSYKSLVEAINHGSVANNVKVKIGISLNRFIVIGRSIL